jgi:hypothetical protein
MDFIMEIIITGCWALWDQRNNMIFNHINPLYHLVLLLNSKFIVMSLCIGLDLVLKKVCKLGLTPYEQLALFDTSG